MQKIILFLGLIALCAALSISDKEKIIKSGKTKQWFSSPAKLRYCLDNSGFKSSENEKAVSKSPELKTTIDSPYTNLVTSDVCTQYESDAESDGPGKCFMYHSCIVDQIIDFTQDSVPFSCCFIQDSIFGLGSQNMLRNLTEAQNDRISPMKETGIFMLDNICNSQDVRQNAFLQKQCRAVCSIIAPIFIDRQWFNWLCQDPYSPNNFDRCVCEWA